MEMEDVPVEFGQVGVQDTRVGQMVPLIQPRRGPQSQIPIEGGGLHRRYLSEIFVPRMPEGLDLFYKVVPIVILSSIKCPVVQQEYKEVAIFCAN